jgi:hypothetical protein
VVSQDYMASLGKSATKYAKNEIFFEAKRPQYKPVCVRTRNYTG